MRGSWVKTKDYVAYLHSQGYGLVWGSWCDQGDSPYILMNATSNVSWPSFVDRASFSGGVIPLYAGVWYVRVPYG